MTNSWISTNMPTPDLDSCDFLPHAGLVVAQCKNGLLLIAKAPNCKWEEVTDAAGGKALQWLNSWLCAELPPRQQHGSGDYKIYAL